VEGSEEVMVFSFKPVSRLTHKNFYLGPSELEAGISVER
jgi:hypothetical protein